MMTKDYFSKIFYSPILIIVSLVLFVTIFKWFVLILLCFIWGIVYLDTRWHCNIYKFEKDQFELKYPRRWSGPKSFVYLYSQINSVVFMRTGVRTGRGHRLKIIFKEDKKNNELLYYSSLMNNKEEKEFIEEFKNRLGSEKVVDLRFGSIMEVPK